MSEQNENKVTPLQPYLDGPQPPRRSTGRLVLLAVLMLAAVVFVCVLIFRDQIAGVRRAAAAAGGGTVTFDFGDRAPDACRAFSGGIAAVTAGGMTVYDAAGTPAGTAQHSYAAPVLVRGGKYVLGFDAGGRYYTVMDGGGNVRLDAASEGTLLDADLSSGDALCTAELLAGYRTVLTVYDAKQRQTYRWYSASRYLSQCAVSPDGKTACAAALCGDGGTFETRALLLRTDAEEPVAELSLGGGLVWDLRFLDNGTVCAVTENGVRFFTADGAMLGSYDCDYLKDYALDGDGFVALSVNRYQAGSDYAAVTLDAAGNLLAEEFVGEEILSLSASGGACAVLTPAGLNLYDRNLASCGTAAEAQTASEAVLQADGSVLLVRGGAGTLYIPD